MSRLLLEIGTEPIPAGYLPPALEALAAGAKQQLADLRLPAEKVEVFGTAKRLVLIVHGVPSRQEDRMLVVHGPRVDVAFKEGVASKAAEGFARKNGVAVDDLIRVTTERGELVAARIHEIGRNATDVLPQALTALIEGLSWPKTMVWDATRFRFPRPVRWVVSLLDADLLPLSLASVPAGRLTRGHWLLRPGDHPVKDAGQLPATLKTAGVMVDPAERRKMVVEELAEAAAPLGGVPVADPALVDEVIFLTEHPTVLSGGFDAEFLQLPREIIVTAMRSHQRYFAVEDGDGTLLPRFLVVCDGAWQDPSQVIEGNERVLRARLSDARFYWDVDNKKGLDQLADALDKVTWIDSVGSLGDKGVRLGRLVEMLGKAWFASAWPQMETHALRAARLAKADLASEMIKDGKEFTGLQGVMGARYAQAQGEHSVVSGALAEQYLPRGSGDRLPQTETGILLAFADRLDTVVGCWAAGFIPTGSQDPYALRRAANGIIRLLLEQERHLSLKWAVTSALGLLPTEVGKPSLATDILGFFRDRLAFFLREEGISYDVVDAVLAADADDPLDARERARALQAIRGEEALERLVVGCKRAANILKGVDPNELPGAEAFDESLAHPAERNLHEKVVAVGKALDAARAAKDYPAMLRQHLELRGPIDQFFDDVMVMAEDPAERNRRLALLSRARDLFHDVFDPARIVIEGEA